MLTSKTTFLILTLLLLTACSITDNTEKNLNEYSSSGKISLTKKLPDSLLNSPKIVLGYKNNTLKKSFFTASGSLKIERSLNKNSGSLSIRLSKTSNNPLLLAYVPTKKSFFKTKPKNPKRTRCRRYKRRTKLRSKRFCY